MMFEEILVCLDGSPFAEKIIPYARGIARSTGTKLSLLRVVEDWRETSAAERYLQRFSGLLEADGKVRMAPGDAAAAIVDELGRNPRILPAITSHGRSGVLTSILGSVALNVIRGAGRPVLLYRPSVGKSVREADREVRIASVVALLDGSVFSERILPFAAEMTRALKAKLELVRVLPVGGQTGQIPAGLKGDLLESSYLHRCARETKSKLGLEVDWDVLHGDPAEAICNYVEGRHDVMLAMTSHARRGLERAFFGSVTSECMRRAGVPIMVYWPKR